MKNLKQYFKSAVRYLTSTKTKVRMVAFCVVAQVMFITFTLYIWLITTLAIMEMGSFWKYTSIIAITIFIYWFSESYIVKYYIYKTLAFCKLKQSSLYKGLHIWLNVSKEARKVIDAGSERLEREFDKQPKHIKQELVTLVEVSMLTDEDRIHNN